MSEVGHGKHMCIFFLAIAFQGRKFKVNVISFQSKFRKYIAMKKKSVCLLIRNREYSDQNNRRRDFKILMSLICYVSQLPLQILKSLIG